MRLRDEEIFLILVGLEDMEEELILLTVVDSVTKDMQNKLVKLTN